MYLLLYNYLRIFWIFRLCFSHLLSSNYIYKFWIIFYLLNLRIVYILSTPENVTNIKSKRYNSILLYNSNYVSREHNRVASKKPTSHPEGFAAPQPPTLLLRIPLQDEAYIICTREAIRLSAALSARFILCTNVINYEQ